MRRGLAMVGVVLAAAMCGCGGGGDAEPKGHELLDLSNSVADAAHRSIQELRTVLRESGSGLGDVDVKSLGPCKKADDATSSPTGTEALFVCLIRYSFGTGSGRPGPIESTVSVYEFDGHGCWRGATIESGSKASGMEQKGQVEIDAEPTLHACIGEPPPEQGVRSPDTTP